MLSTSESEINIGDQSEIILWDSNCSNFGKLTSNSNRSIETREPSNSLVKSKNPPRGGKNEVGNSNFP